MYTRFEALGEMPSAGAGKISGGARDQDIDVAELRCAYLERGFILLSRAVGGAAHRSTAVIFQT